MHVVIEQVPEPECANAAYYFPLSPLRSILYLLISFRDVGGGGGGEISISIFYEKSESVEVF